MKNTKDNDGGISAESSKTTENGDNTQVLVVLSDNGIEEIPFIALQPENMPKKGNECTRKFSHKSREPTRIPVGRNRSLPINLTERGNMDDKPLGIMNYLEVPNASKIDGNQLVRKLSTSSIVSKSTLSSFGIYSAPETPMSVNSPSPSNVSPSSADVHQKFRFPEPQSTQIFEFDRFMLGNFQHLSKSADAIQKEDSIEETSPLKWSESRSESTMKDQGTTKRKKSILERIGSNMSDRSLLSRRLRRSLTNWSLSQNSKEHMGDTTITLPKTKRSSTRQRYRIVAAKTGQQDGISFESIDKPGFFLRAKGRHLEPERDGADSYFNKDCTFVPLPDMWFTGFFAFESVGKPSFFIRLNELEELTIDRYDGTSIFKEDASFKLKKRPCTTCLQAGVKGWVKMSFGGFCLGKVIAVSDNIEVSLDEGKYVNIPKNSQGFLIPDVVPEITDLSVGARVISQWLDRDFLYPGIITGVKGNEYEIQFDDGDKGKCQAYQIRLVRDHLFQEHSCNSHSHNQNVKKNTQAKKSPSPNEDDDIATFQRKRQQFSQQRQGKLWSCDMKDESSRNGKVEISPKDSISSSESQEIVVNVQNVNFVEKKPFRVVMKNLQMPVFETETMSQDSGYHGYQRR